MSEKLSKSERICRKSQIDTLFLKGKRGEVFPLKYIFLPTENTEFPAVSMMVSVPKKVFKRAWKRNLVKRRVRESYRRQKHALAEKIATANKHLDIAFICALTPEIPSFEIINNAVAQILEQIIDRTH